jgi:transcriptional regulator with XRE-family HTH domain
MDAQVNTQNGLEQQLGTLLKRLRLKKNLSQEEVARNSDIAHNYYGEIERNRREPGRDTLTCIAQRGLKLNLNETNVILVAGGFAPLPLVLTSTEMARLYKIVESYLQKMSPYPTVLSSRLGNILKWNGTVPLAFGTPLERIPARQRNLLRLIFDATLPWREGIVGWENFARYQIALFQRNTLGMPAEVEYQNLMEELSLLPDFLRLWNETSPEMTDTFMAVEWVIRIALPLPIENRLIRCRLMLTYFDQYAQLYAQTFLPIDQLGEDIFANLGQAVPQ